MSWALSVLEANRFLGPTELITTSAGAEVLCGIFGLPYAGVSTALDGMPGSYPAGLFSMAKIYSYSLQQEPFLHLDGDVVFGARPAEEWLAAPVVCQNIERDLFFYRAVLDRMNDIFSYLPFPFGRADYAHGEIYSCNAGLFGGSDIGFIQQYCREATEFIEGNLRSLGGVQPGDANFIYEQYLLYCLARKRGVVVRPFLGEVVEDPLYKELVRFQDIPVAPIIHPVGGFKRMQWVCNHVARRLRGLDADVYYRIIDVLRREGVSLRSRVYEKRIVVRGEVRDVLELQKATRYARTGAALEWLVRKYGSWERVELTSRERDCLDEVYRLEAAMAGLTAELYEEGEEIDALYQKDIEAHQSILRMFSLSREERLDRRVGFNPGARIISLRRKWVNDKSGRIEDIISLHFESSEDVDIVGSGTAVIVPAVLQLSVSEYYLDELDGLIVEACMEPCTIRALLTELEQCFDATDLESDYASYVNLINECVKRLLFAEVLVTYHY